MAPAQRLARLGVALALLGTVASQIPPTANVAIAAGDSSYPPTPSVDIRDGAGTSLSGFTFTSAGQSKRFYSYYDDGSGTYQSRSAAWTLTHVSGEFNMSPESGSGTSFIVSVSSLGAGSRSSAYDLTATVGAYSKTIRLTR